MKAGHKLVDVSPSLTSQYRSKRGYKKNDEVDAENVARVALANPEMIRFRPQRQIEELKTLTRTRDMLVEQLTAQRLSLSTTSLKSVQQALEAVIIVLQTQLKTFQKEMAIVVKQLMPELLDVTGIGVVNAATLLLAEIGDARRFKSQHAFARSL